MAQKGPGEPVPGRAQQHPGHLWHAGRLVRWEEAMVHATSLGWPAIGAVFEGVRAYWSQEDGRLLLFRLDTHLRRLAQSMKLMRMAPAHTPEELQGAVAALLRQEGLQEDAYIQVLVHLSEDIPGYEAAVEQPAVALITARPSPSRLGQPVGAHGCVSTWTRISDSSMPPRVKALANYQNSRMASTEARLNGYDYGIMLNAQGKVAEAAYACVFLLRDGTAITPPVTAGILESVARDSLMALLRAELRVPVLERDVDRTELYVADEVLLCGTALEVQPLVSVDRYAVGDGRVGPVATRLCTLLDRVARGREPRYGSWVTAA